jgi:hypothetical protein
MGDTQDKTDAYAALGDTEVQDYLGSLLSEESAMKIECDCEQ